MRRGAPARRSLRKFIKSRSRGVQTVTVGGVAQELNSSLAIRERHRRKTLDTRHWVCAAQQCWEQEQGRGACCSQGTAALPRDNKDNKIVPQELCI